MAHKNTKNSPFVVTDYKCGNAIIYSTLLILIKKIPAFCFRSIKLEKREWSFRDQEKKTSTVLLDFSCFSFLVMEKLCKKGWHWEGKKNPWRKINLPFFACFGFFLLCFVLISVDFVAVIDSGLGCIKTRGRKGKNGKSRQWQRWATLSWVPFINCVLCNLMVG